ncbi:MAG: transposase [Bacteroidetes bacterium]|nr:transposase [Bacteroidota bacterium]
MARLARVVVPGYPHHIIQRGNRRQQTFFSDDDYQAYIDLMSEWCDHCGVEIWCYCLMPNHIHLIAVPESTDSLMKAIGEAHRRYARMINFRKGWRGYFWQGRFSSFIMDEMYLLAAVRYIELNPVRAKIVDKPEVYKWSSCKAHFKGDDDKLVKVEPLKPFVNNWESFLYNPPSHLEMDALRKHERTGRPLGGDDFIKQLESETGRFLRKRKPGPKGPHRKE